MNAPLRALTAIAAFELRRRWRSLVVVGLVAGFVGGAVCGAVALARRTSTAHDRLEAAVHVEDARVLLFGPSQLADQVEALPGVRETWRASLLVAKVQRPGVAYVGITSGPPRPADLYTPIVVEGRAADPDAADEAVVIESAASMIGVRVGDEIPLKMLLPEEVAQFDTGFGEPDGPDFTLRITGVVRVAGDLDGSPLVTTPAFAAKYGSFEAGASLFVRLDDRRGARDDFLAGAAALNEQAVPVEGAEEFDPVQVTDPLRNEAQVSATSHVLVGGLAVFAAVVALVGLVGLAQIAGRQQGASADQQRIEAALGLTSAERALARALPALLASAIAVATTFAVAVAAGVLEPSGVMRRVEPHPGWAPNLAVAAVGAVVAGFVTLAACAIAARRAGVTAAQSAGDPSRVVRTARWFTGRPAVVAGLGFAFAGHRRRNASMRYSLTGVVFGVAGLVAALTFASSLDRLASTPSRYGWNGDFSVVDVNDDIVAELVADPRIDAVTYVESKSFVADGQTLQAYSYRDRRGTTGWTIIDGHAPREGELVLTAQSARHLGVGIGDAVSTTDAEGSPVELVVTGLGLGPNSSNERLDELAMLHPDDLARLGRSQAFSEALVRAAPNVDVDELMGSYASRYELGFRTMPADVANIVELGNLPEWLGAFLAVIAVVALVHLLAVVTSRRARDLAVLRALGFTRADVRRVVAFAALSIATLGLLVGVPLGFALGRLVWWAVAHAIGIASDASYAVAPAVALVPVVWLVALAVAWWPARRATRAPVTRALRAE